MLVETDSEAEAETLVDSELNSNICLLEADSEALAETDVEFNSDSDALTEINALASEALIDDEVDTLIDSEINSDTEAD